MNSDIDFSPAAQAERRNRIWRKHNAWCRRYYEDDGTFRYVQTQPDLRTHCFHAISWLAGTAEDQSLANRILRRYPLGALDRETPLVHAFSHTLSAHLLCLHDERLDADNRAELRSVLSDRVVRGRIYRSRYSGYNDNYPTMDAFAVLVAPRFVEIPDEAVEGGLEILRDLARLHRRRGCMSEYASPTYTPLTTMCLAQIVQDSPLAEARELALAAEHRLWLEMAGHWHVGTSTPAGPHSRAYWLDVCGHLHSWHLIFHHVFGEAVFINPDTHLFPYRYDQQFRHHQGSDEALESHTMQFLAPDYHPTEEAVALAWEKKDPTTVIATSDFGAFPRHWGASPPHPETPCAEFAAGHTVLTTHHTADYALGSSRRDFLNGGPNTHVHLVQRRRIPARDLADICTTFSRYIVNAVDPGPIHRVEDDGRSICLQHENTVMALYRAKSWWNGPIPPRFQSGVTSLKLSLLTTALFGFPEEVRLGPQNLDGGVGESVEALPVFVRNGPVYWVAHPLAWPNPSCPRRVQVRRINGFLEISFYNYEGALRQLSDYEWATTLNGFVFVAESAAGIGSFDAFCAAHARPLIQDDWRPASGMRRCLYRRPDCELALEISPLSEGIRYATINGELAPEDRFSVNGQRLVDAPPGNSTTTGAVFL